MALKIPKKDFERLAKFDALIVAYGNGDKGVVKAQAEKAEAEMRKIFKTHGYSYGQNLLDFRAEVAAAAVIEQRERDMRQGAKAAPKKKGKKADALSLVHAIVKSYIDAPEHDLVSISLWILWTHVHTRYQHAPRLSLTSATPACGKTTVFKLIFHLGHNPISSMSTTTAALVRNMDTGGTVIVDEAEHIFGDSDRVNIIKGGFDKGAKKQLHREELQIFGPLALGGVNRVPGAIASRAINIHLFKSEHLEDYNLQLDDPAVLANFHFAQSLIADWADKEAALSPDEHLQRLYPKMPEGMKGSREARDKWLPLISVADSFSTDWGKRARAAALAMIGADISSIVVQEALLLDCEAVFDDHGHPNITCADMCAALLELDGHYPWSEYRGSNDDADKAQRKLRVGDIKSLLWHSFRIDTRKFRDPNQHEDKPLWYFERKNFERQWRAHKKFGTKAPPADRGPIQIARPKTEAELIEELM